MNSFINLKLSKLFLGVLLLAVPFTIWADKDYPELRIMNKTTDYIIQAKDIILYDRIKLNTKSTNMHTPEINPGGEYTPSFDGWIGWSSGGKTWASTMTLSGRKRDSKEGTTDVSATIKLDDAKPMFAGLPIKIEQKDCYTKELDSKIYTYCDYQITVGAK